MRAPFQPSLKKAQVQVPYIKDREITQVRNPSCHFYKSYLFNSMTDFAMMRINR